jgi:PBP1b-binding outer membrane lipoprotein LpoB
MQMNRKIDIRKFSNLVFVGIVAILLGGCMAAAQHKDRMDKAHLIGKEQGIMAEIREMEKDILTKPDESGERHIKQDTDIITLMELGALYHYAGMYRRSNEALQIVYAHYTDKEMLTDINLHNIGSNIIKGAFSEALGGAYELAPYEKVYLHNLKALNYLMLNEPESAMVEVRRAEHQQAKIEDELAKKKAETESEQEKNSEKFAAISQGDYDNSESEFMKQAALSDEEKALISGLKDGYRKAMTYNLSSIVYELGRIIDSNAALSIHKNEECIMKGMKIILLSAAVLSLTGCATTESIYKDTSSSESSVKTTRWQAQDVQSTALAMVDSLLDNPVIGSQKPIVRFSGIRNKTSQHIDTKRLSDRIRTRLIQSQKVRVLTDLDAEQSQRDYGKMETQLSNTRIADKSSKRKSKSFF